MTKEEQAIANIATEAIGRLFVIREISEEALGLRPASNRWDLWLAASIPDRRRRAGRGQNRK